MQDLFGGSSFKQAIEPKGGVDKYQLLPKGEYNVVCSDLLIKESSSGRPYIDCTYEVIEGQYTGVTFRDMYMADDSESALKALGRIHKWVDAVGLKYSEEEPVTVDLLEQLVDKEFTAYIWVAKSNNPKYKDQNKIGGYKPIGSVKTSKKTETKKAAADFDDDQEIPF